jgi:hypothetical protein
MASTDSKTLEGITFDYEKDGRQVRKEVGKEILFQSGSWATVGVKHQDLSPTTGEFKDPRVTGARFKRVDGVWRKQSGFNVNTREQAEEVIGFLRRAFGVGE